MHFSDDTIVALATPEGPGALAILRISGMDAWSVLKGLVSGFDFEKRKSHQAFLAALTWKGKVLDEALVTIFKAPNSYTGESVVELSLHGSMFVRQEVLKACVHLGCRLAQPGEFTQRAFLNGKLDLAQAEAVGDLIAAETESAHRTALHQLKGGLSSEIKQLRQQLIDFTALIELELDFGEEDVAFADRSQLRALIVEMDGKLDRLVQSFSTGQAIRNGIPVVIVGPPNAGKSTLLNALLGEEKAIVSPIPGTTRDVIEDQIILEGLNFRFVDTAGLRKTEDLVESIGIRKTREQLEKASFALLLQAPDSNLIEVGQIEEEIRNLSLPYLKVFTKSELYADDLGQRSDGLAISVHQQKGLEELKQALVNRSVDQTILKTEQAVITNLRHYEALQKTKAALAIVSVSLEEGLSGDLLASDIREALFHLGQITGEITVEEVLGSIFSRFCIGK